MLIPQILQVKIKYNPSVPDEAACKLTDHGKFSSASANDKITDFGVEPAECSCCIRPGLDNIQPIFVSGNFANHIWQHLSDSVGINHSPIPLHSLLKFWWNRKPKNDFKSC